MQTCPQHLPLHGHERKNGGQNLGAIVIHFTTNHPINAQRTASKVCARVSSVYTGRFAVFLNCRRQSATDGNHIFPLNYTIFFG